MSDPLDLGRAWIEPHQFAGAADLFIAPVEHVATDRQSRQLADAVHSFDLVAVRIGEANTTAATRFVDLLNGRGARNLGEPPQVILVIDPKCDAKIFRWAKMRNM